jgi:hypothetical protein
MTIEYKIRPVIRYLVTRQEDNEGSLYSSNHGEFPDPDTAFKFATTLAELERNQPTLVHEHVEIVFPIL